MKCQNCNIKTYGLLFVWQYPSETMIICEQCMKRFTLQGGAKNMYKLMGAFIEWLHLNNDELLEFQKSNEKTQSNRDTSTDQTPNP
jgi:hypothetical protein